MTSVRLLSHAALEVVHDGTRLLLDPWLFGTCYDCSWALLPDVPGAIERLARPDFVAFSHAHADHLHPPSVKALIERFGPDLAFLVPRQIVHVMTRTLTGLGARNVREVPLNETVTLGPGLSMSFHACRADDSAQIIRAGEYTFFNANDCRIEGALLRDLCRRAPAPTFYFGQFSLADGYPFCFDGLSEGDLRVAAHGFLEQFVRQSRAFGARWSVPTASFVRFAHAENADINRFAYQPAEVAAACTHSVASWYPGDGWSDTDGHMIDPRHRAAYEAAWSLPPRAAPDQDLEADLAARVRAAADRRFADMCRVIPHPVLRRLRRLGFYMPDIGSSVAVDWPARRWQWHEGPPSVPYYRVSAPHFLRVIERDWGFSTLHIAARFRVYGWQHDQAVETFMPVSSLYALGYFSVPRWHYLQSSTLQILWQRRVELVDVLLRAARGVVWSDTPVRRA